MTRETFQYQAGLYNQGMIERRKRLRDEDVELFCRYWLSGRDATWICSQFKTVGGKQLHWTAGYSHVRRMVEQGILPTQALAGPVRNWGPNGQLLAASVVRGIGKRQGMVRAGRPTRQQAAMLAGLPDQSAVVQRTHVPWQQQAQERRAREAAEAEGRDQTQEPADSLSEAEKAEAQQAANRRRRRRGDPAAT